MQDDALNRAVVTYVWGSPPLPFPSSHPEAVHHEFGDQAEDLLRHIDVLLAELDHIEPDDDLADYGRRIEDALRERHTELDHDPRVALSGRYTYSWR